MIMSLGKSIMECASLVKGGVLVFFPSYSVMKNARDLWERNKLIDDMKEIKPVH